MGVTYLDVSDVVEYFSANMTASGIQRVQLEFIRVFSGPKHEAAYRFVIESKGLDGFTVVEPRLLMELVQGVDTGDFTRETLTALLMRIRATQEVAIAGQGDIFFISGAFWASSSALRVLWAAKERGALVGFLCYDLIPIRQPEFCDAGLSELFSSVFGVVCQIADFIFTISVHVQRDTQAYLKERGIELPVIALPLAHELAPSKGAKAVSSRVKDLIAEPFVLFVSTIEARKNHAYAFRVWQRLIELDPALVPNMIWVGRPGWLVGDLMERVRRVGHLDSRLKIVSNLNDAELQALYKASLFSFYPSLAEGWGLPVAESLMFGKTSVCSMTTSLPEVGGDFVTYIDPENVTEGVETIERLLREPKLLATAEKRIAEEFKPRLWRDVCADLAKGFERVRREVAERRPLPAIRIEPGELYAAGSKPIHGSLQLSTARQAAIDALFDANWYAGEVWGRWLKGEAGSFSLDLPAHDEARDYDVILQLLPMDHWRGRDLSLRDKATGQEAIFRARRGGPFLATVRMRIPGGRRQLELRADRIDGMPGHDPRKLSVGLKLFGYVPATDDERRAEIVEQLRGPIHSVEAKASESGPQSRLKRRSVLIETTDWRWRLVERTLSESPRITLGRLMIRCGRWISRGRLG